jgi:hypothetical protein
MTKRNQFRSGLIFGMLMTCTYIISGFITKNHLTSKGIIGIVIASIISGAIGGLLFGWLIGKFSTSKFVSNTTKIIIDPDEQLIFESQANHFKGIEAVGGKLYLTDKKIIFKSHKLNIQNHKLDINLSEITQVNRYKHLGLISNGFSIQTVNNRKEKFVVENIDEWISILSPWLVTTSTKINHDYNIH